MTDCGNFTLDFKQHGFCASPLFLQTLGPWFNKMLNLLLSEKRTLDHWATVQLFFSTAQVRCFWRCFCFRSGLVALFSEDVWVWWLLIHWLELHFTPCVWIGFAWQYSQACCHPCCLCTFSYPISSFQSTLHLICFDTALLEQPPLSVMTLCDLPSLLEGVNDRLLDHWQVISVPHYCAFNEQAIPRISTLWMVIYWNSNILRSRFLTFISCKL